MSLDFLDLEILSNQVKDYLIALSIFLLAIAVIQFIRRFIVKRLKKLVYKTSNSFDDALVRIVEKHLIPGLYLGSFYLAVSGLALHPILDRVIEVVTIIIATVLGIRLVVAIAEYALRLYWFTHYRNNPNLEQGMNALIPAVRTIVWAVGIIFLLDNLGFNISAVVASLGIGGVAIALASQGVLQDLFSYFAILLDRPFEIGDFIIVGDYVGEVEYVGIKTTRLKSIDGEQIIIANTDLTGSRIRNFKRMRKRRVSFKFGVTYGTSNQQLEIIPSLVKNIIDRTENATFDRAHFFAYGDYSLDYEVVYFIDSNDYNEYMNAQQQINLKLKQELADRSIEFAYPTQINYLHYTSDRSDNNGKLQKIEQQ